MIDAPMTVEELKRRFIAAFCKKLSLSLKSEHYKPVLWDVFYQKKIPCLQGQAAKSAFDAAKAAKLYAFYEYDGLEEPALLLPNASCLSSCDLLDEYDLYLMPPDFSFAYCITHQEGCGPYFCRAAGSAAP